MNRDITVIRKILPRLAQYENRPIQDEVTRFHLRLMLSGNMITGETMQADSSIFYRKLELTNEGYDLLTSISNEDVWESVLDRLDKAGLSVNEIPLSVVKEIAHQTILSKLEL